MLDDDCQVLQRIWQNLNHINLIEILPTSENYEELVDNAIEQETDTLILVGHGTTQGLLFPDFNIDEYIIHENNVHLINAQNIICCWCYASTFCQTHNLHNVFATSMFISNINEAYDNGIYNVDQNRININGMSFYSQMNNLLLQNVPLNEWIMRFGVYMDIESELDIFNRQGLYYCS